MQNSSTLNIPNDNILTVLPSRADALKNYTVAATAQVRTDDYGLDDYQTSLEELLKLPIKDEERL